MKKRLSLMLASCFYLGKIPGAPGTYASVATTLIFFFIYRISYRILPELHLSAICLLTVVGVLASDEVSRNLGSEDPQIVVIDEAAGQLLTFLFLPVGLGNLVLGTLLFRIFDIWKPYPIRRLEPLANGVGIMADDLAAGVYANLILQAVNWWLPA
jgi:phosphatidylglycerophosphatase A